MVALVKWLNDVCKMHLQGLSKTKLVILPDENLTRQRAQKRTDRYVYDQGFLGQKLLIETSKIVSCVLKLLQKKS